VGRYEATRHIGTHRVEILRTVRSFADQHDTRACGAFGDGIDGPRTDGIEPACFPTGSHREPPTHSTLGAAD